MGVDYRQQDVADHYVKGRALGDDVLSRWKETVTVFLPDRPDLRVLDVGAGSGIFARAWPHWHRCSVVALEPSGAMRAGMLRGGVHGGITVVAGQGEQLPLATASIDVAWLSAVIHHFTDLELCVAELARVLVRNGVVFVRGLFADRSEPAWLGFFPAWERTLSVLASTEAVRATMGRHGFRFLDCVEMEEAVPATVGEAAERARRLRDADSLLVQFSDEDFLAGLAAMDQRDPRQRLPPCRLDLLVFAVQYVRNA